MLYLFSIPTLLFLNATHNAFALFSYYSSFAAFILLWCSYYIGNRYFDFKEDAISQPTETRHSKHLLAIVVAAYTIPFLIFTVTEKPLLPFLFLAVLTLIYSTPLVNGFRVKQIPFIKNACAAGTWWITVAFFVHYYVEQTQTLLEACIITATIFPIMLIIELLWDVRDIEGDRKSQNHTIPVLFGLTATKVLIFAIVGVSWLLGVFESGGSTFMNVVFLCLATLFVRAGFPSYFYHSMVYVQIIFMLVTILLIKTVFS